MYTAMVDCPEIQGLWEQKAGDRCTRKKGENNITQFLPSPPHKYLETDYLHDHFIWLPRQEDIQEMLKPGDLTRYVPRTFIDTPPDWNKLKAFWEWFEKQPPEYQEILMAFNAVQLWLVFYMYAVHNKRWTDEGWV